MTTKIEGEIPISVNEISAKDFQDLVHGKKVNFNLLERKTSVHARPKFERPAIKELNVDIKRIKAFFIPGSVPSKKRAYIIVKVKRRSVTNKEYKQSSLAKGPHIIKWEKQTAPYFRKFAEEFRQASAGMAPVWCEFFFLRNNKRKKWDFGNMHQILTDQMSKFGWIDDDAIDCILPLPPLTGDTWRVDTKNPGVMITIVKLNVTEVK
jgi:hypothetical protein